MDLRKGDGWRTPTAEHIGNGSGQKLQFASSNEDNYASSSHSGSRLRNGPSDNMVEPSASGNNAKLPDDEDDHVGATKVHLSIRQRLKHVTWAWFTIVMATGGIASTLKAVPFRFPGLYAIGVVFFLGNIVVYVIIWGMIICRFWWHPYMFKLSFQHPTESLFIPAVAVSFGTILINIVEYGSDKVGIWLNRAILVLFWFDSALAIILSITIYFILWSTQSMYTIARMTPIWIFPAYPLLIIGPHAAALAPKLRHPHEAIQVIVGGFTIQGIGFLVSVTVYAAFVYRLMTQKLPAEPLRPGMFVSVGPSAFTASGVIGMASSFQTILSQWPHPHYMGVDPTLAASILTLVANWACLWLWGLAFWFFFISLLANAVCFRRPGRLPFAMAWFSFIFPQTALTKATFRVAEAFDIYAMQILGCVMTVILIIGWFLVVGRMIHAVVKKQVLWPETGEDKSEGGFEMPKSEDELKAIHAKARATALENGDARPISRAGSHILAHHA